MNASEELEDGYSYVHRFIRANRNFGFFHLRAATDKTTVSIHCCISLGRSFAQLPS